MDWLSWLKPWEVSPVLVACFLISAWLFVRGQRVHAISRSRQVFFWLGWGMLYFSMHTMLGRKQAVSMCLYVKSFSTYTNPRTEPSSVATCVASIW